MTLIFQNFTNVSLLRVRYNSYLARTIESDQLYFQDRSQAKFMLFTSIVENRSSYVRRQRDNSVFEVVDERLLTEENRKAHVVSDQIARRGLRTA